MFTVLTKNVWSLYISGKLPTYSSRRATFCPKWEVSVNVSLGERSGWAVAPCEVIIDSLRFWISCCGFQIPGILVRWGFLLRGIWIRILIRNPKPRIPDSTSKKYLRWKDCLIGTSHLRKKRFYFSRDTEFILGSSLKKIFGPCFLTAFPQISITI